MALDDGVRRAQAKVDKDDEERRTKEEFQAGHVPRGVDLMRALLHDAVQGFKSAGIKPTHVLRSHGKRNGLLDQLRPTEYRYEELACGWPVRGWFLGVEGVLYRLSSRYAYTVVIRSVKETKRAPQRTGNHNVLTVEHVRGALRLGLLPGDKATITNHGPGTAVFQTVDISAEMSASEHEPPQGELGGGSRFVDVDGRSKFVVSPSGGVYVSEGGYDASSYKRLEDVLGAEIVTQKGC